jgi:starch synthase (maltosyl-transferring)
MAKNRVTNAPIPVDGRSRVVIQKVRPEVDNGRYPIKRTVSKPVTLEADVFVDGHDKLVSLLLYRRGDETK